MAAETRKKYGIPVTVFVMLGLGAVGLGMALREGARAAWRDRFRGSRGLRGLGPSNPLHMAEFVIGRDVGEPIGHVYQSGNRPACQIGSNLSPGTKRIDYGAAKAIFLRSRAHFVGDAATGATLLPTQGVWMGGEEPGFIGQVIWFRNEREPTPQAFRGAMKRMCEDVACRLAQKEVLLRLTDGDKLTVTRCSARGKDAPA